MNSVLSAKLLSFSTIGFILMALIQFSYGQGMAPSPAPAGPSNDGAAIDQGIAYVLLFAALAITYLLH